MNYFLDLEFLEGPQKKLFGYTKPTIDLISIGIVCEDGREYYAISKDFNLKEAWNRYDIKIEQTYGDQRNRFPEGIKKKVYWIRENVLKSIYEELIKKEMYDDILAYNDYPFSYSSMKYLIKKYGKSNKQIAEEVVKFTKPVQNIDKNIPDHIQMPEQFKIDYSKPQFYGYYSDYDWVCFCWLFGKMIDLPKGFPMFAFDLKQVLDEKSKYSLAKPITNDPCYPKQINEHNALADARWNFELYKFLNTLWK